MRFFILPTIHCSLAAVGRPPRSSISLPPLQCTPSPRARVEMLSAYRNNHLAAPSIPMHPLTHHHTPCTTRPPPGSSSSSSSSDRSLRLLLCSQLIQLLTSLSSRAVRASGPNPAKASSPPQRRLPSAPPRCAHRRHQGTATRRQHGDNTATTRRRTTAERPAVRPAGGALSGALSGRPKSRIQPL